MKKFLSTLALVSGLAVMFAASGCDTAPERHPRTTQTVTLSIDRVTHDVAMEVITAVEIVLPPGPQGSEGYVWEITSDDVKVLEQMGPMKPGPRNDALAAPVTSVSFFALKPGRSVLRFALIRPNEAEAIPAAKCEVTVRVSD
jgi:predicted secreted protein